MVRISSKLSHHRIQQKQNSVPQSIEINSDSIDQSSSSKILNVVRQALLNAAEELVSHQENQPVSFHSLDINNNDLNKPCQRNGNAIKKKKKLTQKNKKINRRK